MNLASWIILAVVVAVVALAIKATFFGKKKGVHPCCGDVDEGGLGSTRGAADPDTTSACCAAGPTCGDCAACQGAVARNLLQPTIRDPHDMP